MSVPVSIAVLPFRTPHSNTYCCEHETASRARADAGLATKTRQHSLVNLSCHAHVVQVIYANLGELAGLIEIEYFAAFNVRGLAGFKSESPGHIVEPNAVAPAQPPAPHRVEHSAHVVFAEINQRLRGDVIHQTALIDKREIETDNVVTDNLVTL